MSDRFGTLLRIRDKGRKRVVLDGTCRGSHSNRIGPKRTQRSYTAYTKRDVGRGTQKGFVPHRTGEKGDPTVEPSSGNPTGVCSEMY